MTRAQQANHSPGHAPARQRLRILTVGLGVRGALAVLHRCGGAACGTPCGAVGEWHDSLLAPAAPSLPSAPTGLGLLPATHALLSVCCVFGFSCVLCAAT